MRAKVIASSDFENLLLRQVHHISQTHFNIDGLGVMQCNMHMVLNLFLKVL
jgi:hypothetical protein